MRNFNYILNYIKDTEHLFHLYRETKNPQYLKRLQHKNRWLGTRIERELTHESTD